MTREGDVGTVICGKDAVEDPLGPDRLVGTGLTVESYPQLVVLGETRLDPVAREEIADVGLVAAAIARVSADAFAEILLDLGEERVSGRHIETVEGVIRRLETPRQRTGVVALGCGDLLVLDLGRPERIDCKGLGDSQWGQVSVGPSDGAVSVQFGVVAVPCGRAVVSLRIIMVAVTVPAHVEQLVFGASRSLAVELSNLMFEALPLSQVMVVIEGGIGWICAIDEAKVCGHEVEGASIGRGLILQEVSSDCSIVDVRV